MTQDSYRDRLRQARESMRKEAEQRQFIPGDCLWKAFLAIDAALAQPELGQDGKLEAMLAEAHSIGYNEGRNAHCPLCNSLYISRVDSGDDHYEHCDDCGASASWTAQNAPAQAMPEGFVLVPKEPTQTMLEAAYVAMTPTSFIKAWKAALAAAPHQGEKL